MSKPVVAILPTDMRAAFENSIVMPGGEATANLVRASLKSKRGKIFRRQMWYRTRSHTDRIKPAIK